MQGLRQQMLAPYQWVLALDDLRLDEFHHLGGTLLGNEWEPMSVKTLDANDVGSRLLRSDVPWLSGQDMVFRDAAFRKIRSVLDQDGEFLELSLVDGSDRLWLFNALHVIDALDEEVSEVVRFPSSGRIMKVSRFAFNKEPVAGRMAFKIPQLHTLFFTGEAVEAINAANLVGCAFETLWKG